MLEMELRFTSIKMQFYLNNISRWSWNISRIDLLKRNESHDLKKFALKTEFKEK